MQGRARERWKPIRDVCTGDPSGKFGRRSVFTKGYLQESPWGENTTPSPCFLSAPRSHPSRVPVAFQTFLPFPSLLPSFLTSTPPLSPNTPTTSSSQGDRKEEGATDVSSVPPSAFSSTLNPSFQPVSPAPSPSCSSPSPSCSFPSPTCSF